MKDNKYDKPDRLPTVSGPDLGPANLSTPPEVEGYEILRVLGEGGMGVVYLARQKQPIERQVALKVIKTGMDSKQVITRFEAERQALALLDHPNIAQVYDAGTTKDGHPFFSMECIDGPTITDYCDRQQLSIDDRLELFTQICEGVQHAHQKGIVHRDIKPSNVLVYTDAGKPLPKIIDFGVAKAVTASLTEQTLFTEQGNLVGTPEYMSPEQAEMTRQDIDTRSDVYSLGILLYVLLTGMLPFDRKTMEKAGLVEILRIFREQEPPRPSTRLSSPTEETTHAAEGRNTNPGTLARLIRGDLDWIVMKSLEKDRDRRYSTAAEFAADIRRHLNNEPVQAGPPTASYKLRKFIRRHRVSVVAASLVMVALVVGSIVATYGLLEARQERDRAVEAEGNAVARQQEANMQRVEADLQRREADNQRNEAKRNLYLADMLLARQSWETGRVAGISKLLYGHVPGRGEEDLRSWEWHYLHTLCNQHLITLGAAASDGSLLAARPDGCSWLTTDDGRTINIWKTPDFGDLGAVSTPGISSVAMSPDARYVTSVHYDRSVRGGNRTIVIWDWREAKPIHRLQGHEDGVVSVAWQPNGQLLASLSKGGPIRIWDCAEGKLILSAKLRFREGTSVTWSPDGTRLACGGYSTVQVLTAATGEETHHLECKKWGNPLSVAWSPDGRSLAVGHKKTSDGHNRISLWNLSTKRPRLLRDNQGHGSVNLVAWSPDGHAIASATDHLRIKVWDPITGRQTGVLRDHKDVVKSLAWSPDGQRLLSAGLDDTIKIWDWGSQDLLATLYSGPVYSAVWSKDGHHIASVGPPGTRIWDATKTDSVLTHRYDNWISSVSWSPDGKRLATAYLGHTVDIWDPASRQTILTLEGHKEKVWDVTWSPDGQRLATASSDYTAKVWDAINGEESLTLRGHSSPVKSVVFALDGGRIITGSEDGTIRIWDAANGNQLISLPGHSARIGSIAVSPDGRRAASARGRTYGRWGAIKVWDVETTEVLSTLTAEGMDSSKVEVNWLAWSPDGEQLAAAAETGLILVWDIESGRQLFAVQAHTGAARCVRWSADDKRLATGGDDGTVTVRDTRSGEEILTLRGHEAQVSCLSWSPDGRRLASGGYDKSLKVWDASVSYEIETHRAREEAHVDPQQRSIQTNLGRPATEEMGEDRNVDTLEILSVKPSSFAVLEVGDRVAVTLRYRLVSSESALFWVTPLCEGEIIEDITSEQTAECPKGEGSVTVGFTVDHSLVVDGIDANMGHYIRDKRARTSSCGASKSVDILYVDSKKPITMREDYVLYRCRRELLNAHRAKENPRSVQNVTERLISLAQEQIVERAYGEALIAIDHAQEIRQSILESDLTAEEFYRKIASHQRLGASERMRAAFQELYQLFAIGKCMHEEAWFFAAARTVANENPDLRAVWSALGKNRFSEVSTRLRDLQASIGQADSPTRIDMQALALMMAFKRRTQTRGRDADSSAIRYTHIIEACALVLDLDPGCALALNDLAWLLSTCPVAELRNGTDAVKHAQKACRLTDWKNHRYLMTLAAAHAEAGNFEMAVKRQKEAADLIRQEKHILGSLRDKQARLLAHYEFMQARYESQNPYHEGLVGWWMFDGAKNGLVPDMSGNEFHGTLVGDATIAANAERGNVLNLNGDGGWVDCGNDGRFNITSEITVSAWVKVAESGRPHQAILSKGDGRWGLKCDESKNAIEFVCHGVYLRRSSDRNLSGRIPVSDGRWHHVVGVRNLSELQIYVDGKLDRIGHCTSADLDVDDGAVWIGKSAQQPDSVWNGLIDDVRVYSHALTGAEVRELHGSTKSTHSR